MEQVITGIQTTGTPHLGNILGAIRPAISVGKDSSLPPIYIVADMHSMLSVQDPTIRQSNTMGVTAAWLAFGVSENGYMYRQSHIPELSQFAMLLSGTALSERIMENGVQPNLFNSIHTILMSADLLMLRASHVPVGQDSSDHIKIVQDTARCFNNVYGDVLAVPDGVINNDIPIIPGIDGLKMSKSSNNIIDVLGSEDDIVAALDSMWEKNSTSGVQAIVRDILVGMGCEPGGVSRIDPSDHLSVLTDVLIEEFRKPRQEFTRLLDAPDYLTERLTDGEAVVMALARPAVADMRRAMGMG